MVLCAVFVVLYSCPISFSAYGNKEERFLCSNFKSKKELLLVTEHCSNIRKTASIFLDTFLKYRPSACIRFRLTSNLFKCTIFSNNNIVLVAEAELNIFIFCRV